MKNQKARGYSDVAGRYVEGVVYGIRANGIEILTDRGRAFVENGQYELIKGEDNETV